MRLVKIKKRITITLGIMSEGGRERPLTIEEYEYWERNKLPPFWTIIAKPMEQTNDHS